MEHVDGINRGHVVLYAISTCPWCNKVKRFLNELGVDYFYEDVDLLGSEELGKVEAIVAKWNPKENYPTMIINDEVAVIGDDEEEIRKALGL